MQIERFHTLLDDVLLTKIPDLHLTTGMCPYVRGHDGAMRAVQAFGTLSLEDMRAIASFVLPADRRGAWPDEKEMDASFQYGGARFRVNAYYETRGPSFAFRLVANDIPSAEDLGLPKSVVDLMHREHGLVLIT